MKIASYKPSRFLRVLVIATALSSAGPLCGAQPLPKGKARFSVVFGNMDDTLTVWARLGRWTFDASAGTVIGTFWQWDTVAEKGKTVFGSHTCTFDGVTKTCTQYTPTGFFYPAGQYFTLTGDYVYNESSGAGALTIAWSNNRTEVWSVTIPETGLAKVDFVSSTGSSPGYGITHGKGYGSNAAWTVYKSMAQVPLGTSTKFYRGTTISVSDANGAAPYTVAPSIPGAWSNEALNFSTMTLASNGLALHMKSAATPSGCLGSCYSPATGYNGVIYHFAGTNTGRAMIYNHHCACLSSPSQYPCYPGTIHPYAIDQIVNDSGTMRGMVGVHQQDQPGSAGFSYSMKEWLLDL